MGTVVRLNTSDKKLRDKIEHLDECYAAIKQAYDLIYDLEMRAFALEYEYGLELEKHIKCVGKENVAKDLFDYTVEENESTTATAGGPGED